MATELMTITGIVRATNTHGVKLDGETEWRNYSKFSKAEDLAQPFIGQQVTIGLDKAGFVRTLAPIGTNGYHKPAAQPAEASPAPAESAPVVLDTQRIISRQAMLNTATSMLSSGGRAVDPKEAVALAAKLEQWVWRQ